MSGLNRVELIGYLGADPEMRGTENRLAALRVATSERWKDRETGEQQERTEWHSVKVFGPAAEYVEKYARKGGRVFVAGRLQTSKWKDQEGIDRWRTEVVVAYPQGQVILLTRREGEPEPLAAEPDRAEERTTRSPARMTTREQDDDIPF